MTEPTRIIVLGNSGVGKSFIVDKYIFNLVANPIPTIGIEFRQFKIMNNNNLHKFYIWDTGGNMSYINILKAYYKSVDIVILVFDLTNITSFIDLTHIWFNEIQSMDKNPQYIAVVGTKCDLPQAIPDSIINDFIKENNITKYYKSSGKKNININNIFTDISAYIISKSNFKLNIDIPKSKTGEITLQEDDKYEPNCCTIL
tara:strand:- start:3323 stop:3925 length:603 start_codon:yes stop_codon:yes gene_type:complete